MKPLLWISLASFLLTAAAHTVLAGPADVLNAKAVCSQESVCNFTVTVKHEDSGWDHYANQWEVLTLEGEVLGERVLLHPHVHEQPFTRSLSGVSISSSIKAVKIRARDSVHGYGGREMIVELER